MKNKYIRFFMCIILGFLPIVIFGQGASADDSNKLLQFLKGDGAFEKWFFDAFQTLDMTINAQANQVTSLGRAIGGIGAMLYLGYIGWQMQAGDREWEITPMLKPFFIGLILLHWSSFYGMIQSPFRAAASASKGIFERIEKDANTLRVKRFQKQNELLDYMIKQEAIEKAKQKQVDDLKEKTFIDKIGDEISEGWEKIQAPIEEWFIRMDFKLQRIIADVIEALGLSILRIFTYLIFFIQKIWSYILIVLGPIAVGMALIPGFESSLTSWISKFININLYSFVAFTIINIGQQLIMSSYVMEIDRYEKMITSSGGADSATIMAFINGNGMLHITLFSFVAYVVTGIGVLMTPTIADSIVSAGGATVMSKMKQSAGKVASGANATGKAIQTMGGVVGKATGHTAKVLSNTFGGKGATPKV
ncbi:hypothetical protein PG593_03595 [Riemerella anatipestifer]|uniref:hypothetical protein n=1 Tax=Riemerella anatipestifer TaxID=34085 RepID=UPI00069C7F4A|nr:hypothetical protein [Riemerella anatipestifer]MDR7693396.1 hypothetical protein [Riemerella anatipestifer]MDY3528863.1 hypothetical protein [Riemerella anatipestifer]MDY3538078.1 hypothetical protein [Riemerella anatipestifer]